MIGIALFATGIGALLGAAIGWLVAGARARSSFEGRIQELIAGRAAAESAVSELRKQAEGLRSDLAAAQQQLQREQAARASAETALAKSQESLTEQRLLLGEAESKLKDAFASLASDALRQSSGEFLRLAGEKFRVLQTEAASDLSQRQVSIDAVVNPLAQSVKQLEDHLGRMEVSDGALIAQVQQLSDASKALKDETGSLVTSLRQPRIKGTWGELLLRRAVELAGMSPHCDFSEQVSATTEDGRVRPDLIVHLPGGRQIIVDAKVSRDAYMKALQCRNQDEYRAAMSEHAQQVRTHVTQLSSRRYWEQFSPSPEFVVLFLPAESYFSAALEADHGLIEDAVSRGVVLASPTTLLALLKAVAYGWNQQAAADAAKEIAEIGKELYERLVIFLNHLNRVSRGLKTANDAFNEALGSAELRLMPGARKLREKAAPGAEEPAAPAPIETLPRQISVPTEGED